MEAMRVDYSENKDAITKIEGEGPELWEDICERFNDDVHRVRDVSEMAPFTGLFECIDNENKAFFYIVEEDKALYKYKRRNVYQKLGLK